MEGAGEVGVTLAGLKALASSSRFRILRKLLERRRTATELAEVLGLQKSTIHKHLRVLVDAGFVERHESDRVWVYYGLTPKGLHLARQERPHIVLLVPGSLACTVAGVVFLAAALAGLGLQQAPVPEDPDDFLADGRASDRVPPGGAWPRAVLAAGVSLVGLGVALALAAAAVVRPAQPR